MIRFSSSFGVFLVDPLGAARWWGASRHKPTRMRPPPTVVIVSPPVEESVVDSVDYTGRTDSAETVDIRSRVTGFLDKILFKDGSEVEKGAPLYRIDDREFQADLDRGQGGAGQGEGRARANDGRLHAGRGSAEKGGRHGGAVRSGSRRQSSRPTRPCSRERPRKTGRS